MFSVMGDHAAAVGWTMPNVFFEQESDKCICRYWPIAGITASAYVVPDVQTGVITFYVQQRAGRNFMTNK